jgi:hypothetical protein
MRAFAILLLVLVGAGLLAVSIDGFAPGSNPFHLLALIISILLAGLAGLLWWQSARKGLVRNILVFFACILFILWAIIGYRCYRMSVSPAEDDKQAGNALDNSGMYP